MALFGLFGREKRGQITVDGVAVTGDNYLAVMDGWLGAQTATGVPVSIDSALGVPAVMSAVNFLPGTLASLPLNLYRRTKDGADKVTTGAMAALIHAAANDETSSFDFRKQFFTSVFTSGRGLAFIEASGSGAPMNLWPLDPSRTRIMRQGGRKWYEYKDGNRTVTYEAAEVLDVPFMLKNDGLTHISPIMQARDSIALAIAATSFGAKFFQNGGVPPFAITGKFQTGGSMQRAGSDLDSAVRKAAREQRMALVLPVGLEIKSIGTDAEKSQLVELKRFVIEEVARIYSLPPTFLQDLTHGTYSNTEQQDLHFVKHTLSRWVTQFEQEANLKLFGRGRRSQYVKFEMDGLLRGDFKTRMEGHASAVQSGVLTPNEARGLEDRPPLDGGYDLMIQSATVPLKSQADAAGATKPKGTDDGQA